MCSTNQQFFFANNADSARCLFKLRRVELFDICLNLVLCKLLDRVFVSLIFKFEFCCCAFDVLQASTFVYRELHETHHLCFFFSRHVEVVLWCKEGNNGQETFHKAEERVSQVRARLGQEPIRASFGTASAHLTELYVRPHARPPSGSNQIL